MGRWIEPLEGRSLFSGTAAAGAAVSPIGISKDGIVVVDGTAGQDAVKASLRNGKIYVTRVTGSARSPDATTAKFSAETVNQIFVRGGEGRDTLYLDTYTQAVTKRHDIESTHVRTDDGDVTDPYSTPLVGQLGGSVRRWLDKSAAQIAATAGSRKGAVFLGDSMFERFSSTGLSSYTKVFGKYKPVNLSFGGDTTSQLLYRIQNQGLLRTSRNVGVVVLNIGANNVSNSNDATAIARGIKTVLDVIKRHTPRAQIVLTSILPRNSKLENRILDRVNTQLATLAEPGKVYFVDATHPFHYAVEYRLKYYRPNEVHLTKAGYTNWAGIILHNSDEVWNSPEMRSIANSTAR